MRLIEEGRQCSEVLKLTQDQNNLLRAKIDIKDSLIGNLATRLAVAAEIKQTYVNDIQIYTAENNSLKREIETQQKTLRKQKRKTTFNRLTTYALVAVAGFLILK